MPYTGPMNTDIIFKHVDWLSHRDVCMAFRKDAYAISFGNVDNYNEDETLEWFEYLLESNIDGFLHVWRGDEIIGQVEFKTYLKDDEGNVYSYINLFYLIPKERYQGIGQILHDYVLEQCRESGSSEALLRYIPGNTQAKAFYRKNGWMFLGEPDMRGQLMTIDL